MITVELALRLRAAGLEWKPVSGDRFVIANRGMDADVFVVSELTIDVHEAPTGPLIRFNGTTEWALDSVEQEGVVWLPREEQLRELLGAAFVRLEPVTGGYAVTATAGDGEDRRFVDIDAERAYARAVLSRLSGSSRSPRQGSGSR
jgi:hypothetical protein